MRILHFISSLGVGGAENLIMNYVKLLSDRGHHVEVLVSSHRSGSYIEDFFEKNGYVVIYMGKEDKIHFPLIRKFLSFIKTIQRKKFLTRYLASNKFDIIHMHTGTYKELNKLNKKIYANSKLFYTCHTVPNVHFNRKDTRIMSEMISNGLKLISLNKQFKTILDNMFLTNCAVIGNGILFGKFRNINEQNINSIEKELNLSNKFVVGHVGRFTDVKNHLFLIDVFALIKAKYSNSFLILVGDGELKTNIVQRINELGLVQSVAILSNRNDVQDIMSLFDVFVMPSKYEGFPVSLIEAQVLGIKSVVSSSIPEECIVNNNVIRLDLSDSLQTWAEASLKESKYNFVSNEIERFNLENIINQLIDLYKGNAES